MSVIMELSCRFNVDLQQSMKSLFDSYLSRIDYHINKTLIRHTRLLETIRTLDDILLIKQPYKWDAFMDELVF